MGAVQTALEQETWVIGVVLALIADILSNTGTNLQKLAHTQIEQLEKQKIIEQEQQKHSIQSPQVPKTIHEDDEEDDPKTEHDNEQEDDNPLLKAPPLALDIPKPVPTEKILVVQQVAEEEQATDDVDEDDEHAQSNYCASPTWILGIVLLVLSSLADFLALVYASQSIVSPLGSLTLVVNLFLARWMHGEVITKLGVLATLLIVAGSFLTVLFADHSSTMLDIEGVLGMYFTFRFITYAILVVGGLTFLWVFAKRWGKPSARVEENEKVYPFYKLAVACLNGTLGGHNVLFAKMTATLVSVGGVQVYKYFMFYFTFAMLVLTIVTQVSWLNEGLKRFDAVFMIPVSTSFWVFFSAFSGIVTTGEYMVMSWLDIGMFSLGMLLIIIGVLIFTRHKSTVVNIDNEHRQSIALRSSRLLVVPPSAISTSSSRHRKSTPSSHRPSVVQD